MITWDEIKRAENIKNHGLDFIGCDAVFDNPVIVMEDTRIQYGEQRLNLIGFLDGMIIFMTYTDRGDALHVISLRRATRHEIKVYETYLPN